MKRTCAVGLLAIFLFWPDGGSLHAQAADPTLFKAMNLMRFSETVEIPDVSLPDLKGKEVPLRSFRGKVLLINFWTTW
jgi:hypothetical protein